MYYSRYGTRNSSLPRVRAVRKKCKKKKKKEFRFEFSETAGVIQRLPFICDLKRFVNLSN